MTVEKDENVESLDPWQLKSRGKQDMFNKEAARKWHQRVKKLENKRRSVTEPPSEYNGAKNETGISTASKSSSIRQDLPSGMAIFKDVHKNDIEGQPYVCISPDTQISEVASLLEYEWKITIPTIVLEVISGVQYGGTLPSKRQWDNLKEGLVNAANKTNMWVLTHGLNCGIGKAIGEVIMKEVTRRQTVTCNRHPKQSALKLPSLTLMGIVKEGYLRYAEKLDGKAFFTEVHSEGNDLKENKYELNPHHTHFLIIKDRTSESKAVMEFLLSLCRYLKNPPLEGQPPPTAANYSDTSSIITINRDYRPEEDVRSRKSSLSDSKIPMIALLIGGGFRSTLMVAEHLKNGIPVVVVKGSGGAADLLSFAYEEIKGNTRGSWDPDYVENFIMSELSKKIAMRFAKYRENILGRNKFRDKILECVHYSHKDERVFMDFLDIYSSKCDLALLNEHLLRAMFQAERREGYDSQWHYYMQKDVILALDWNCPHICRSEIFKDDAHKYKIDTKVFECALLRQGREAFVELFLDQGFQVHSYLTRRRFCRLFERAENQDFFRTVTLQGVLGLALISRLDEQALIRDLNWLIFHMAKIKNFIDLPEVTFDAAEALWVEEHSYVIERQALNALVVWAVLMNRPKLARVLWKRADYPIHLAILISMLYEKLISHVNEKHLVKEIEDLSREFALMAVGVLDASFQAGNCRAFDVLSEEVSDYNYKTAVEMAAMANHRRFLAHPCCQKWLTSLFYGDIRTRDMKFGVFSVPSWLKIILSAFLFFPMYFWIIFQPKRSQGEPFVYAYDDLILESELDSEVGSLTRSVLCRKCTIDKNLPPVHLNLVDVYREKQDNHDPSSMSAEVHLLDYQGPQLSCLEKIATLWNAPITKFWTHQIFYVLYLTMFSLATLWTSCGNFYADITLWLWTLLILFEDIRISYMHYKNYSSIRLSYGLIEIVLISIFLIIFMFSRILPAPEAYSFSIRTPHILFHGYGARVVMCLGLLYFFYRFIWIYFPISPTLGRLLFRIRLMVVQDFVHFLRLALLFIVSSGIAIHSVLYPDYPMGLELIRRVFHRAWFTLFTVFISDLEGNDACSAFPYRGPDACRVSPYNSEICPVSGAWPYILVIQYFVILKLILYTLLFALFSDTASKLAADADAIWRYQRYHLVLDFQVRPRLPAPLNIFSFLIMLVRMICKCLRCNYDFCKRGFSGARRIHDRSPLIENITEDFYWRGLAADYLNLEKEKQQECTLALRQMDNIYAINEMMEYQKAAMQNLKVRINELEKLMFTSRISLEEIKHFLNKEDEKFSITKMHLLSRQSPYPETKINRFQLADRYVPWEILYSVYDPVVYSKQKSYYPFPVQNYVDEDLLQMQESESRISKLPEFKWNLLYENAAGVTVDRCSWITQDDGQPLIYKLDSTGLPVNPMGRTGLRGRGCLCRWGPNHAIYVIITRWRLADSFLQSVQHVGTIEDQKILEVLLTRNLLQTAFSLPGGFEHGESSPYNVIRKLFLPRENVTWDAGLMYSFFSQFAKTSATDASDVVVCDRTALDGNIVFRGYVDDTRNTDNAWIEAEVWLFQCMAEKPLKNSTPFTGSGGPLSVYLSHSKDLVWKKYSQNLLAKMVPSHAAILRDIHQKLENIG